MARRGLNRSKEAEDDVNVTPLLDIVFIMLIFFIVTSTFIKEPGIEVNRPGAKTGVEQKLISILVAISENDEIWINQEQVELDRVRPVVKELRRETPKGAAVVQSDAKAKSQIFIDVLNEIKAAGITEISVATTER